MNILLITNKLNTHSGGGREMLSVLNFKILKSIFGEQLYLFELSRTPLRDLKSIINAFHGSIDGLNDETKSTALKIIKKQNIQRVFIDGSNLGGLVKLIKIQSPEVEIVTFFHNIESRFFWGAFRQITTFRSLAVLAVNFLAEKKSVRYSDKIICLSKRDSFLLLKIYGRLATNISPMALQDKTIEIREMKTKPSSEKYALFVGGAFYANNAGISWFVENVVPKISIKICIVGRGFDAYKKQLELKDKVEVVGEVDSLDNWYRNAQFVVAPIFDGSGMKTKVAEALMFGKVVIGTPEAFSGYEEYAKKVGSICTSIDEFVEAINEADILVDGIRESELRRIFKSNYSFSAAKNRFKKILDA